MNQGQNPIDARISQDFLSFCRKLFPQGKEKGGEYLIGNLQGDPGKSLSINLQSGIWTDFASGEKGGKGGISLYAAAHGMDYAAALAILRKEYGDDPMPRLGPTERTTYYLSLIHI